MPRALLLLVGFCNAHEHSTVFYDGSLHALYNHATTECKKTHYVQGKELFTALARDERFKELTELQQHQLLYNKGNAEFLAEDLHAAANTFEDVAHRFDDKKAAQKYAYIKQLLEQQENSQDKQSSSDHHDDQSEQSESQHGPDSAENSNQSENAEKQEQGDANNANDNNSGNTSKGSQESQSQKNSHGDGSEQSDKHNKDGDTQSDAKNTQAQESEDQEDSCDEPYQKDAQNHGLAKKEPIQPDSAEQQKNEVQNNVDAHTNASRDGKQRGVQQHAVPYKPERPDDKLYAALAERDEQVQKAVIRGLVSADDHNQQERNMRGHKTW